MCTTATAKRRRRQFAKDKRYQKHLTRSNVPQHLKGKKPKGSMS